MTRHHAAWLLTASLALAGCSDTVSVESDILIARYINSRIELTNTTTKPVYYFAVDREGLAVVDWLVCVDPAACDAVPPSSTRAIPLEDVALYTPGTTEVAVYHWKLVAGQSGTGFVADSLRMIVVRVR